MKNINLMSLSFILLLFASMVSTYGVDNDNSKIFYLGLGLILVSVVLFCWVLISILYDKKTDIRKHPDFNIYYDDKMKRNYWVLGYFGGGAIPIAKADIIAREYARENKIPYKTVLIDEIFKSRRFKGFKYMYSTEEQIPHIDAEVMTDVFKFLTD